VVPELGAVVVVVTDADTARGAAHARAVAAAGARATVLCGTDGSALGALARELLDDGCRSALFLGDADAGAGDLVELVHELFVAREQAESTGGAPKGDR
jgi:hypothetical protein